MALSNIWVEPRREITESLVGFGVLGMIGLADWEWAKWICDPVRMSYGPNDIPYAGAMTLMLITGIVGPIAVVGIGWLLMMGMHALGDKVCDLLQERGIHLRPRDRWQRRIEIDLKGRAYTVIRKNNQRIGTVVPVSRCQ